MMCCFQRRRGPACAAIALMMTAAPLCAQDAAVPPSEVSLDPQSPLDDMPDLGVDWPDLSVEAEPIPAADAAPTRTEGASELRYRVAFEGLEELDPNRIRERFDALSVLKEGQGDPANAAQIDRRARQDAELLADLLRSEGYYDAAVDTRIASDGDVLLVTLDVQPGPLYRFAEVDLRGLDAAGQQATGLREAFGVDADDPVDADAVISGQAALRTRIGEAGYPFASVGDPQVVVDHDTRTATLVVDVDPGTARTFGRIRVADDALFKADHIQDIARFDPGDPYEASRLEDLRRALIATGLVSTVVLKPVPGDTPDTVDIAVTLEPAPPRTIAGELGYGTGEGIRAEVSWQHRNFFSPEGAVTVRGVAGTREQLIGVTLRRNNFRRRDQVLNASVIASNLNRDAFEARTFQVGAGLERQTNIIWQKKWTWSFGAELLASDERDFVGLSAIPRRRTFFIGALPTSLSYDGSDDLLNPTRGYRLAGRLSPELSLQSGTFGYARAQIDASAYFPVTERVVMAGRVRLGTIAGASSDRIAPSRRYYAGGGGSVRGYGYQDIGPRDIDNNPVGGRSLAEFSLEARIRFGDFGVVPFIDGGNIYRSELPQFSDLRFGAGVGVRYYTSFGPIRVDVGTPLNPQPGDARIAVYVSLGQAF
jgi:translocation and assembly module TamA